MLLYQPPPLLNKKTKQLNHLIFLPLSMNNCLDCLNKKKVVKILPQMKMYVHFSLCTSFFVTYMCITITIQTLDTPSSSINKKVCTFEHHCTYAAYVYIVYIAEQRHYISFPFSFPLSTSLFYIAFLVNKKLCVNACERHKEG